MSANLKEHVLNALLAEIKVELMADVYQNQNHAKIKRLVGDWEAIAGKKLLTGHLYGFPNLSPDDFQGELKKV